MSAARWVWAGGPACKEDGSSAAAGPQAQEPMPTLRCQLLHRAVRQTGEGSAADAALEACSGKGRDVGSRCFASSADPRVPDDASGSGVFERAREAIESEWRAAARVPEAAASLCKHRVTACGFDNDARRASLVFTHEFDENAHT